MTSPIEELNPDGMTYRQILRMLEAQKELILTIPSHEEDDLKRGITRLRSRDNSKMKDAGLEVSEESLSYLTLPCDLKGMTRIQIRISARKTIQVAKIEIPDDSF